MNLSRKIQKKLTKVLILCMFTAIFCGSGNFVFGAEVLGGLLSLGAGGAPEGVVGSFVLKSWEFVRNEHIPEKALSKTLGFVKGSLIDEQRVALTVQDIKEIYWSKGFYFVEVNVNQSVDPDGNLELRYEILEGLRVYVQDIRISGNSKVSDSVLLKEIQSRKSSLFRKIMLEESLLQEDIKVIERYYRETGLGPCRVPQILKHFLKNGQKDSQLVELTFVVEEGVGKEVLEESFSPVLLQDSPVQDSPVQDSPEKLAEETTERSETSTQTMITKSQALVSTEGSLFVASASAIVPSDVEVLTKLLDEKKEVESLLSELLVNEKVDKRKLQQEVQFLKEKLQSSQTELQKEREESQKLQKTLEATGAERAQFLKEKQMAEKKILSLSGGVRGKLIEMEKIRDRLSSVIREAQGVITKELDRVELAAITVGPQALTVTEKVVVGTSVAAKKKLETLPASGRLSGQVLVVNADLNFIVLNLGAEQGSYKGLCFEVMSKNQNKLVGIAKVIEVRRNISAADIQEKNGSVEVGDTALELLE